MDDKPITRGELSALARKALADVAEARAAIDAFERDHGHEPGASERIAAGRAQLDDVEASIYANRPDPFPEGMS